MTKLVLRLQESWAIVLMLLSWLASKCAASEHELWLFCERGTDARDNGYWMFRYIKQHHPEINARYIITTHSEDRHKLEAWRKDLVRTGSFRHYRLMWQARKYLSTHNCGCFPHFVKEIPLLSRLVKKLHPVSQVVWLQHGITKHDMPEYHYERIVVDKLICGAYPEYQFFLDTFHFPKEVACYTGFARFDGLHEGMVNKKQILLMPTWRIWLNRANFLQSAFWKNYSALLNNPELHRLLQEQGMTMVFYPHYEMQPYLHEFEKLHLPACIQLADKESYDVQTLLKESALLITDYSSVFFDFAYMHKPVVFFQFDYDEFHQKHYQEGYFDFRHSFAEWSCDIATLLYIIKNQIQQGCELSAEKRALVDQYFPLYDTHNCERIYQAVAQQGK